MFECKQASNIFIYVFKYSNTETPNSILMLVSEYNWTNMNMWMNECTNVLTLYILIIIDFNSCVFTNMVMYYDDHGGGVGDTYFLLLLLFRICVGRCMNKYNEWINIWMNDQTL